MTNRQEHPLCSVMNCASPASEHEVGSSEHWRFTVFYCDEHWRELQQGVPVGPVGLDASRVLVQPTGTAEPRTGAGIRGAID